MTDWIDILGSSPGWGNPFGPMDMEGSFVAVCPVQGPLGCFLVAVVEALMPNANLEWVSDGMKGPKDYLIAGQGLRN